MKFKLDGGKKAALFVLAAFLAAIAVFGFLKPPMSEVAGSISPDLIEESGDRYNETSYNYIVAVISRGRNVRTAETDTYIGFLGRVWPVNHGFAKTIADVLFWLPALILGARITVALTICSVITGLFFSVFLALGRISKFKPLSWACGGYIFFFRGTPLLMQLFFVYYGLPMIDISLAINNKFMAAYIAFALNITAYCAEYIRAAIQSIDKGQFEASHALGFTYSQAMRLVVIPQSFRRLIPPITNEFIMVLKDASLVSIIALSDLTHTTRSISSSAGSVLVFIPAMAIYLVITAFFTYVFGRLERKASVYH